MRMQTRKLLDRSFACWGIIAIALMVAALLILLCPLFIRGAGAIFFTGTVEHRRLMMEKFDRGNRAAVERDNAASSWCLLIGLRNPRRKSSAGARQ